MDLEAVKRGLQAEIIKRKNETYFTFQTNIRNMCEDCLYTIKQLEHKNTELSGMLVELNEQLGDANISKTIALYRLRVKFAEDMTMFVKYSDGFAEKFWRKSADYWTTKLLELEATRDKPEPPAIIRDPVKINNALDPFCELLNPQGESLGVISNQTAMEYVRVQIKQQHLTGYSVSFYGKKIDIDANGNFSDTPPGFYDKLSGFLAELV